MSEKLEGHRVEAPYSETLRAVAEGEPLTWPADAATPTDDGETLGALAEDQLKAHMVVGRMY